MAHTVIPDISAEERQRSLGWLALWWIESFTLIGRGGGVGLAVDYTPEFKRFIVNCYCLNRNGRRKFRHAFLSRPKGADKSGKAGAFGLFEGLGPCRFAGWAKGGETYTFLGQTYTYAPGEPMGKPVNHPEILCLATSEGQVGNVYETILYNCTTGPLSELAGYGLDAAQGRIRLPEGGEIIPSTSGAASKDGGIETFAIADETHLYTTPQLKNMYNTVDRNLPKRSLDADPWSLETSTMFRPGEDSIAELTYKDSQDIREGRRKHFTGLYFDHRYADIELEDFSDEAKVRGKLYESYGSVMKSPDDRDYVFTPDGRMEPIVADGATVDGFTLANCEPGPSANGFVDSEGILAQIYQPTADVNDSIRYYFNNLSSAQNSWLSEQTISKHTVLAPEMERALSRGKIDAWQEYISKDDEITLGFDGSVSNDSTALVGCRVRDGLVFLIKLEQKPDDATASSWTVDRDSFDGKVRWMFENYNVRAMFADAAYFDSMITGWETDYPQCMVVGPRGKAPSMHFFTNGWHKEMFSGLQDMLTSFSYPMEDSIPKTSKPVPGNVMLLGDRRLVNHFRNARMHPRSFGYLIFKESPKSEKKIDACMAGVLAYMARQKVIHAIPEEKPVWFAPMRIG